MDNLFFWNEMRRPPASALKTIGGGRLKGMTDIKPQWKYEIMTKTFGPVGIGWSYEIVRTWTEDGPGGEKMVFAMVTVKVKVEDVWSEPIPGVGGSKLISKEGAGLYVSDEGYKMAITDALGTAIKVLGVASDIHMGRWNGSKYLDEDNVTHKVEGRVETPKTGRKVESPKVHKDTFATKEDKSILEDAVFSAVDDGFLTKEQAQKTIDKLFKVADEIGYIQSVIDKIGLLRSEDVAS